MSTQAPKSEDVARTQQPVTNPVPASELPDKFTIRRPVRVQLSAEETRKRAEEFAEEREEEFIAAVREVAS
jgi:hypothetical protein